MRKIVVTKPALAQYYGGQLQYYEVVEIQNSIEWVPGDSIPAAAVDSLCRNPTWDVIIK